MTYEEYLLACRNTQSEPNAELQRVASLKTLTLEIAANQRLGDWLEANGGAITVVTEVEDAVVELCRLKAEGAVIGIDIETAKAQGYQDHPQAGLHPEVSQIRLVQLFVDKSSGVVIIDCFSAGYGWLEEIQGGHYVAHNAQFERSHFWHHIKQELTIDCTMLAGRVFYGDHRKLAELAAAYSGDRDR
jgi:hypothetical protein